MALDHKIVTGYILTVGWAAALVAGILTGDFQAIQYVIPGWLIYLGFLFGDKVVFNRGGSQ